MTVFNNTEHSTNIELSILIPTFNREIHLKNSLSMLARQNNQDFYVIISDNASTYDVESVLSDFSDSFSGRCKIIKRKYNSYLDINLMDMFNLCITRFAWVLADDDIVLDNAIETIYKWIRMGLGFGCIDFAIYDSEIIESGDYISFNSINGFTSYHNEFTGADKHGDLIFFSNKVIDLQRAGRFLTYAFRYIYMGTPLLIVIAKMLEAGVPYGIVFKKIVEFRDNERSWDVQSVILATRIMVDIPFKLSSYDHRRLLKCLSFDIDYVYHLYFVDSPPKYRNPAFFEIIYNGLYRHFLPINKKIRLIFYSCITKKELGFSLLKTTHTFSYKLLESTKSMIKGNTVTYKVAKRIRLFLHRFQ